MINSMTSSYFDSLPRPFALIGFGVSGRSVLKLLKTLGVDDTDLFTFDKKDPSAQFSSSEALFAKKPNTFVVSPGFPLKSDLIYEAREQGLRITSELSLASSFLQSESVIAVTGSVGKSTTTCLLGEGAKAISENSFVGGNLGFPLAEYVDERLKGRAVAPWIILELSSYQLECFDNLSCSYSAFTSLTPNHMDRYSSIDEYYSTKMTLLEKTTTASVCNRSGGNLMSFFQTKVSKSGKLHPPCIAWTDKSSSVLSRNSLLPCCLIGGYNLDNLAVAAQLAEFAHWPKQAFAAMANFRGLPHRLENLGTYQNISFINDSKATTIESVKKALETVLESHSKDQRRVLLLLGGRDKCLPWQELRPFSADGNILGVFFGEFGSQAKQTTEIKGPLFPNLHAALDALPKIVQQKDVVLLSPGGTSHDEFRSFEERGQFFKETVLRLFKT